MKPKRLDVGIFKDRHGIRAFVKTRRSGLKTKRFKRGALGAAKDWRKDVKAKDTLHIEPVKARPGTFGADVEAYLSSIDIATKKERKAHLQQWVDAFGPDISRHDITPLMVRQQIEAWRTSRPSKPYSASWLNHRRTALMNFYTVTDGIRARNPAAEVPKKPVDDGPLVPYTWKDVRKVLKAMPASKSKTRLEVIAWTGWPHSTVKRITAPDLAQLSKGVAYRTRRKKGKGVEGGWVPLLAPAIKALRNFKKQKLYGPFSSSTLRRQWKYYCWKANVPEFTPYHLRHIFGGHAMRANKDERSVADLMQHSDIRQTRRYTRAMVDPKMREGVRRMKKAAG